MESEGHDVQVLDCVMERMDFDGFRDYLKGKTYDVFGITATTPEIGNAHKVASFIKEHEKSALTIIGGPHSTALPKDTLENFKDFDVAIIQEGERSVIELLKKFERGEKPDSVRGIAYRDGENVFINEPREHIHDLDSLPFPAWDKFRIRKYKGYLGLRKKQEIPILTGRGCPSQCIFCQRALGSRVRFRDPKKVVDEIERDVSLGAESILVCDETFTLIKKRVIEICDEIIKRELHKKIEWHCETRADRVDLEILKKMKEAGCVMVNYGVESGNDYILEKIKKGITVEQVRKAFRHSQEAGLKTYMNLIFGHPFETRETIEDSINLLMEINPDYVTIGIMVPFPGTEIQEMAKKGEGGLKIVSSGWDLYAKQDCGVLSVNDLTNDDLKRYHSLAYTKFYIRPSRIMRLFELVSVKGVLSLIMSRFLKSKA
jgi:radical SAM superfamily enzyme YgiQ (UPF0313 family)